MDERVGAVVLELAEADAQHLLERLDVRLVVIGRRAGVRETGETRAHAFGRQVLDHTVVGVEPGVLPHQGNHEVTHRLESGLHRADTSDH